MATSGSSLQDTAKETARAKLSEQQQAAAGGIGEFAGALRKSAEEIRDQNALAGRLAQTAAEGLERVADTIRSKDVGSLMRDTERFAREQPIVFFSAALAVGFLAVRFLKSSSPERSSTESESWSREYPATGSALGAGPVTSPGMPGSTPSTPGITSPGTASPGTTSRPTTPGTTSTSSSGTSTGSNPRTQF